MQLLYDILPIIIFFIAFKLYGIYVATVAAIIISVIQVFAYRYKYKKYEKMQLITMIMIVVLGGITLILHKPIFIKWKVTAIDWIFAIAFFASHFIGKKPLICYIMEKQVQLPRKIWVNLNISWTAFFFFVGLANLYVVYNFSTNAWVNFKLFGVLGLTFVFVILQAFYIAKYVDVDKLQKKP